MILLQQLQAKLDLYLQENDLSSMYTVDPGFNTAIAHWSSKMTAGPETHFFSSGAGSKPIEKVFYMWDCFEKFVQIDKPQFIIIEGSQMYQDSLVSTTSAAKGDLLVLTGLLWGYARIAQQYGIVAEIKPPIEWKGQMSKEATKARVQRELGFSYRNDHVYDAVGIGLSIFNKWRVNT